MKLRICMVTTNHSPFDRRIFLREAKTLKGAGYEVTVVAPAKRDFVKEVDGIKILGIEKFASKTRYLLFIIKLFIKAWKVNGAVYHSHEPESLLVGALIKIFKRKKLIYDAHEHYQSAFPFRFSVIICFVEKFFTKLVDEMITINESLRKHYRQYCKKSIVLLYNCPSLRLFNPQMKNEKLKKVYEKNKVIIYEGYMIKGRGLDKFLMALRLVRKELPKVKFLIVGKIIGDDLKQWVKDYVHENGLAENFDVIGWKPYEELAKYINISNVGVILFQPTKYNNWIGLPNKLFEYMACQKPVIASNFPEMRRIVEAGKCGVLVNPTDPTEIANAIIYLLKNPKKAEEMGKNGRKEVESKYNWERMEERLLEAYRSVLVDE